MQVICVCFVQWHSAGEATNQPSAEPTEQTNYSVSFLTEQQQTELMEESTSVAENVIYRVNVTDTNNVRATRVCENNCPCQLIDQHDNKLLCTRPNSLDMFPVLDDVSLMRTISVM